MTKWKLAPVEPTPEMIKAGADVECIITGIDEIDAPEDYKRVFMAMLEAAPQPELLSDARILEIWANNSGRPVTTGKARIIAQARAIEREILGGEHE